MVKVIASDMDGTFLNDDGTFDEKLFQEQLKKMAANGMHFISASGNQYQHLLALFDNVTGPISYVCNNGALVVDENGVIISETIIDHPVLQSALDYLVKDPSFFGAKIILVGRDGTYCNLSKNNKRFKKSEHFYPDLQSISDLTMVFAPIYKIEATWEEGSPLERQTKFNHKFSRRLTAAASGNGGLDIVVSGTTKSTGVDELLQSWQLTFDDVVAFGDNNNDFELLNEAKLGYAMKNSAPDLLAKVAAVTAHDNNEQGVQKQIDQLLG
ncbi:Cof-type HAD-IIB family hydrolase [Lentilactobacillus diolivorans]|uniref:Cof-type HAD-IIB family hydrolase n=1 Tax=Lentilactobacillus diolivorans TaxID=179838 RepID=UPI002469154F|nr:Cof-type HAD-IIB family hydrolase [Lentilactobacillus diolivorans]MDH5106774.1 Cof-type HAD-IIB family hydrolase [Lentilactobacillus diolivorans]